MIDPHDRDMMRTVYIVMAALAGAITSLSLVKWREMPWGDRLMTLFVGSAFALIFVPWAVSDVMRVDISALRAACATTYIGAIAANSFIPRILMKIRKVAGLEEDQKNG